jgi:hypothetical protein
MGVIEMLTTKEQAARERKIVYMKNWHALHHTEQAAARKAWKAAHPGYNTTWNHANGRSVPMAEAKDSSLYLGVHIAEHVLSNYFEHVKRMPHGNPGFDFICGRGFKIDVKSACLRRHRVGSPYWPIRIRKNKTADYFLVLLFNNRDDLEPMHLLLIPGSDVNHLTSTTISSNPTHFAKWAQYERPLDKVVTCCNTMRSGVKT